MNRMLTAAERCELIMRPFPRIVRYTRSAPWGGVTLGNSLADQLDDAEQEDTEGLELGDVAPLRRAA